MDNFEIIQNPPLDEVLLHYGILGMHWGVRRYQNPDGSLTPAGVARAKKIAIQKDKVQEARAKRKARMEAKLRAKEKKKEEKFQREREAILRDPDKLYKNFDKFSSKEIQDALNRYDLKGKVHNARRNKLSQVKRYVDTVLTYGDTLNKTITFLNTDAGRNIRGALGFGTEKVLTFKDSDKSDNQNNQNNKKKDEDD